MAAGACVVTAACCGAGVTGAEGAATAGACGCPVAGSASLTTGGVWDGVRTATCVAAGPPLPGMRSTWPVCTIVFGSMPFSAAISVCGTL